MTEGSSSSRVAVDAGSNPPGTTTARERKKRKWDQPAESMLAAGFPIPGMVSFAGAGSLPEIGLSGVAYPLVGVMSGSSTSSIMSAPQVSPSISVVQQNAAAIVQKINQDLATKGLSQQPKIQDELIAREIVINDADPTVRYKLTKRQTQEEIQANTGAVVITRGKYRPPNGPVTNEKPLYLHISAGSHLKETAERIRAVDQAAVMVEEILKQGRQSQSASTSFSVAPATGGLATLLFSTSVFVGLEADPNMNLVSKIRGPNDQYINHIMNETGATVILRGRGSDNFEGALGEEPQQQLHLYICSDNGKSLEDAKSLAENLLETVSSEFLKSRPANYPVVPTAPVQSSVPQYPVASYAISSGGVGSYAGVYSQAVVSYTQTHSNNLNLVHSVNPYNLSSSIPQPGSANTANLMATEINKSSCTRVYNAVPPPQQLLSEVIITKPGMEKNEISSGEPSSSSADVTEEASSSMIATSLQATISSSVTSQPNLACIGVFGTSVASSNSENFATTQPGIPLSYGQPTLGSYPVVQQTQQTQPSHMVVVSSGTSYSGYGGIYPQATPLQQVAQALQRPPPPVSVKHGTYNLMNAPTKAQSSYSNGQSEKQPARRRKFQELPMVPKDSSRDNQSSRNGTEMSEIGELSEEFSTKQHSMLSPKSVPIASPKGTATALPGSMPPPSAKSISPLYVKSMPPPSAKCISPLHVKSMPPPSSKIMHQPQTVLKESIRKSKMEDSSHHEVSLKLVEYGEEDDDESSSPRTTKANDESSSPRTTKANGTQYANRKPFWAP